ncbi:cold-shock protein [Streptomyces alkaliphilus]|uniref:cold-shock protein n=1 Tax=Streptomyces alkaliphilus TaxID=1472722 RepID=UPI001181437F|nr:cold shock domain-containing protein [Streptomyces alkaliphilus]MQS05885.1 cold shock domain-containing protein [Streptomyces alkaliphilus]
MNSRRLTSGVVRIWHTEDGWGVIESPETPGGVFAHFSVIDAPAGTFRSLHPGDPVDFEWEHGIQDELHFRATWVKPAGSEHGERSAGEAEGEDGDAYTSTLKIRWDEEAP